ncbi:MAG: cytochrome c-type biogenesis protein CcmH [Solirubrobacterales bacterium]|jgi:cytochrome c-type biogenesis protein CcmH|nr:cytochrome c-type biogenesis protein CcmH [Solirubrobacterales bacterium]
MRLQPFLALLLALALLPAASVSAAAPRTTLPDVEDEVMCTQCGTALNISEAPSADRERAFIRAQIAKGRTKEEIKAALADEYGPRVLAVPSRGGFDRAAFLVPALLGLLALGGVLLAALRWRRGRDDTPQSGPELDQADSRRLDAELRAFKG